MGLFLYRSQVAEYDTNVDAISGTGRTYEGGVLARGLAFSLMSERVTGTGDQTRYTRHGFKGVTFKGVTWAERDDVWMISVMGYVPPEMVKELAKIGDFRPSRLDLALTVRLLYANPILAASAYESMAQGVDVGGQLVSAALVQSDTGSTLYLGKRNSRTFCRIYDKSLPLFEDFGTIWRFEAEFHKEKASSIWEALETHRFDNKAINSIIVQTFARRDVNIDVEDIQPVRISEPLHAVGNGENSRLNWFSDTVIPSIHRLYQNGEGDALEALFSIRGLSLSKGVS